MTQNPIPTGQARIPARGALVHPDGRAVLPRSLPALLPRLLGIALVCLGTVDPCRAVEWATSALNYSSGSYSSSLNSLTTTYSQSGSQGKLYGAATAFTGGTYFPDSDVTVGGTTSYEVSTVFPFVKQVTTGGTIHRRAQVWRYFLVDNKPNQSGYLEFPRPLNLNGRSLMGLDCSFDFLCAWGNGGSGLSFNFGKMPGAVPTNDDLEKGYGNGLSVSFTYNRPGVDNDRVSVYWRGESLANEKRFDVWDASYESKFLRCEVKVVPDSTTAGKGSLTVRFHEVNGLDGSITKTTTILDNKSITFDPGTDWSFGFGGRTSGDKDSEIYLNNIQLRATAAAGFNGTLADGSSDEGKKVQRSIDVFDPDNRGSISATSSDPALTGSLLVSGKSLSFTPPRGKTGTASITVTLTSDGRSESRTFNHTVNDINERPTLGAIDSLSLRMNLIEDTEVSLSGISPGEGDTQSVTVTAISSNPKLLPNPRVEYSVPNSFGTLRLRANKGQSGEATVTVTVKDEAGLATSRTFVVNVAAPGFQVPASLTIDEDSGPRTVTLSNISDGDPERVQTLSISATSLLPGLVDSPVVTYDGTGSTATLQFQPRPNANSEVFRVNGNPSPARIQVVLVNEDGTSVTNGFEVTVTAVADKPLVGTGGGVDFAGTSMAETGDAALAGTSFSVELWAKRHAPNSLAPFISQGTNGFFFGLQADNFLKLGFDGPDGPGLLSPAPYADTGWHHWAATYEASNGRRRLYRDGILLAEDTAVSPYAGTGRLFLGGVSDGRFFNGAAQEIRLWRSVRSLDEILLAQTWSIVLPAPDALLGYWRADEGNWPRLENSGAAKDSNDRDRLDGLLRGTASRIAGGLQNLNRVLVPEKTSGHPMALPAFNPDSAGFSGLEYLVVREPASGSLTLGSGVATYAPRAGFAGTDSFSYRVRNGNTLSETVEVPLEMRVVDDPPTISIIADQLVYSESGDVVVPFSVSDEETPAAELAVNVTSSDLAVLPLSALEVGGSGTKRTLAIRPQPGVFASPTVTVTVTDGAQSVQRAFIVQLAPTLAYRVIPLAGPVGSPRVQPLVVTDDGRIAGFGETLAGQVSKPFVNRGFFNEFALQANLVNQEPGRVTGMAVVDGVEVAVGEYRINGEWRAFVHDGRTLINLGKPAGSSGSRALGVNSSLQVVGYSTTGSSEQAFLSSGNPDSFAGVAPPGTSTSRAVAVNDSGTLLIRSGATNSFLAWIRRPDGGFQDLGAPAGFSSPNPISIANNGLILAEVLHTASGTRRLASHLAGEGWTVLDDASARWTQFEGGRMNGFRLAAGTARTNSASGAPVAVVRAAGRWYALNDLVPTNSGWNLETATSLNEDGFIVGTGRRNGVQSAFLAIPANIIGQRVPRPEGAVARYPSIRILEGGVDDDDVNSFLWSELEKSLYAIRPVTARIDWFTSLDPANTSAPLIPTISANIWPREPKVHVATVPVDTEPVTEGATYRFAQLVYTTDRDAGVDPATKKFNSSLTNGEVYSVFHFLKTDGRALDPLFQTNAFLVVRTLPHQRAPLRSEETAEVGQTLAHAGHIDHPGKNGYLFFTNSVIDVVGEQASYKQSDRSGALNVVNTLTNARNANPAIQAPLVVWYEMTPFGVSLPNRPVTYRTAWPTNASRIIIASQQGSNLGETDPITNDRYPQARLYSQPNLQLPGFNPNEEHSLILPSSRGNAVYSLRNDLNAIRRFSEPFALLKYKDPASDEWRIKPYSVVIEQAPWFLKFSGDAGKEIQPPLPLSLLPLTPDSNVSQGDWFQDYNSKVYARAAGPDGGRAQFVLRWFYPLQPGFFYDLNGDGQEDVPVGSSIPWLDRRAQTVNGETAQQGRPVPTVYDIRWPDAPVLQVGQTLTTPVSGLPDVRNMANLRMIYDSLDPSGQDGLKAITRLFDPISERYVPLGSTFVMSPVIKTATDSRGRQVFVDLPYALRARLSYDPANKWLYFGSLEDRTGIGEPLVLPNIMTPSEAEVIKALAANATGQQRTGFQAGVDALYDLCRNPNRLDLDADGQPDKALLVGLVYGTNVTQRTLFGRQVTVTNAVPEVFAGGPKALTAADAGVPPALPQPGNALRFPADQDQRLTITQPKGTNGLRGSFTLEFWIRNEAGSSPESTLVRLGGNSLKALRAGYRSGYLLFEFNTQRVRTEDPVFNDDMDTWVHYALVHDADAKTAAIHRNGITVGFAEGFNLPLDPADNSPLHLGGDPSVTGRRFVGLLDEIRLWDGVARRGSQTSADSRKKLAIGRDGLAGYWRFDTATGTRVPDDSGRGLAGTVTVGGRFVAATDAPYGIPPRYVTMVANNDPKLGGLPVSLYIIEVDDGPYRGDLKVLPNDNVFDSRLILRHSSDFAGRADGVEFEWWYHPFDPYSRTNLPVVNPMTGEVTDTRGWIRHSGGMGLNQITLGGPGESGLLVLSDNWFILRFKGFNVNGRTDWSDWIGDPASKSAPAAMLAEGWIKRVIRGLNPFDARSTDFNSAQASTVISMLQQAGARYEGDIAFNPDPEYLNSIGLIEAYQTVLNRGIGLSIEGVPSVNYGPANDALLLAASRIADLYGILGNEAMADAADPTIGFTTGSNEYGATASSIFAFQNQLDSLLEEELALLRGRDDSGAGVQGAPVYNRLLWNFTLGDGEVAYSQVYNVSDQNRDGRIDEKDARVLFPQGHGDAWGHYLTAIKGLYGLLRHPNFTWQPRSESVLLAGVPVKVDYLDERKFATLAANKAKAGAEIVDLTYRDKYVADPAGQWQGYTDTDPERAWGVSEWAQRAASAAYFDWLTGNAILPSIDPDPAHTGLDKIDRQTVGELAQVAAEAGEIVAQIHKADNGLNPLGLAGGVVPFDIDPAEVAAGRTHFEQVAARAKTALLNARALFDEANAMTVALRRSADSQSDLTEKNQTQERELDNKLIEIFGYPYAGDIGPGKTYPSGYSGPDIIHHLYVETAEVSGVTAPPDSRITGFHKRLNEEWVKTTGVFEKTKMGPLSIDFNPLNHAIGLISLDLVPRTYDTKAKLAGEEPPSIEPYAEVPIDYPTSSEGYAFNAPAEWGKRRALGEIQVAIQEMVQQQARFKQAVKNYDNLLQDMDEGINGITGEKFVEDTELRVFDQKMLNATMYKTVPLAFRKVSEALNQGADKTEKVADAAAESLPKASGTAVDATAPARGAIKKIAAFGSSVMKGLASAASFYANEIIPLQAEAADQISDRMLLLDKQDAALQEQLKESNRLLREEPVRRLEVFNQREALDQAADKVQSLLAKGQRVMEDRRLLRADVAGDATKLRYRDMAFRMFRNEALNKYRSQFDLAARYVYLAATAYDYEVNLIGKGNNSGSRFLTDILRHRTLGQIRVDASGVFPVAGRMGLADPLARLEQNFAVQKTQMGFNNPQTETGRFSLRNELFRLRSSSDADWRKVLKGAIVPNVWNVPEFRRFCRPFAPESAGAQPALVLRFPTSVTFGLNFFGWPLGGGDSAYDPSNFATKIRSVGVWFSDYNGNGLAMTPRVYLVPVGADVLRSQDGNDFETRMWRIVDQKIPIPFPIGSGEMRRNDYLPSMDSLAGGMAEIRKFSSFRAYHDAGSFSPQEASSDSRLIGRSVWNTEWMLVIPGGTLLNDPNAGLDGFIQSVSDIKLFFQTYAYSGN